MTDGLEARGLAMRWSAGDSALSRGLSSASGQVAGGAAGQGLALAVQRWGKRALDLALAALGLVLAAPLMGLIALAIPLDTPGPVLFRQWRAGKDKRPFRMLKFRTMVDGAEAMLPGLLAQRGLREPVLKVPDDPRVTRVGRWLRAT
ncbi:MAG: sugar transferase, partial [Anaerolineae bacterium]